MNQDYILLKVENRHASQTNSSWLLLLKEVFFDQLPQQVCDPAWYRHPVQEQIDHVFLFLELPNTLDLLAHIGLDIIQSISFRKFPFCHHQPDE